MNCQTDVKTTQKYKKKFNQDIQSNVYEGIGSLNQCIEDGKKEGKNFFVAVDQSYQKNNEIKTTKKYIGFNDAADYWKKTSNHKYVDKNLSIPYYEIIPDGSTCNLIADLEWSLDWKSVSEIEDKITSLVKEHPLIVEIKPFKLHFLNASRESANKGSLHMHSNNVYFADIVEQRKFWNEIYIRLENQPEWHFIDDTGKSYVKKSFIDFGIYNKNRMIRLIFSTKMGSDGKNIRPLLPPTDVTKIVHFNKYLITSPPIITAKLLDCSVLTSEIKCSHRNSWSKSVIQHMLDKHGITGTLDNLEGSLVKLKNKTAIRECVICHVQHTDNGFVTINGNELTYHCHFDKTKRHTKVIGRLEDEIELELAIPFHRYMKEHRRIKTQEEYNLWYSRVMNDINRYACVILAAAKPYILYKDMIPDKNDENKLYSFYLSKKIKSFHESFENMTVMTSFKDNIGSKPMSITRLWYSWEFHNVKKGETCIPGKKSQYFINTFQGLKITELEAFENVNIEDDIQAKKFFDFYKNAACESDEQFDFLIKWLAHIIQKPGIRMKVAPVFKGHEGVGKGCLMNKMKEIIGDHNFLQPSSLEELEKFNEILNAKLLVFMDEMTWGGDKRSEGWLKKFITEDNITVEEKYGPKRVVDNICNVFFTSNNDHILPAGNTARRFVVYEINDDWLTLQKNEKDKMYKTCPRAVARYLYRVDLSTFIPWDTNKDSTGLTYQKLLSLNPTQKWWFNLLTNYRENGNTGEEYGNPILFGIEFPKKEIYLNYCQTVKSYQLSDVALWKKINEFCSSTTLPRKKSFIDGKRINLPANVIFPEIDEALKKWNTYMNCDMFLFE